MALQISLNGQSARPAGATFECVTDLRLWDSYAGVSMQGPAGMIAVGDRVDITLAVGRQIRCGMRVDAVARPHGVTPGVVVVRSIAGPVDGSLHAEVRPTATGSELEIVVRGVTRGAARLVERPLEVLARQWLTHQLDHLLRLVETRPPGARSVATRGA